MLYYMRAAQHGRSCAGWPRSLRSRNRSISGSPFRLASL